MISLTVNGSAVQTRIKDNAILLDVLRDQLRVQSVKASCWRGECGLCTVLLNGKPVKSCLVLGVEADGTHVVTAEGLVRNGMLSPIQKAFVEHGAMQCGFCTPAFVLTAHHLLTVNPSPTEAQIKEFLSGHICRCGTYKQMVAAVLEAAKHYRSARRGS